MTPDEKENLAHASGAKKGNLYKRAKKRVKKVAGLGDKEKGKSYERRPSTNPVSLAASEALYRTKKTLKLSVSLSAGNAVCKMKRVHASDGGSKKVPCSRHLPTCNVKNARQI